MPNLVWCSVDATKKHPALFTPDRNYDILLHDYSGVGFKGNPPAGALWHDAAGQEKLFTAAHVIDQSYLNLYDQFAFLDDDLHIPADYLNRLFAVGDALALPLYQPALTPDSHISHQTLRQQPESFIRKVPFVEIMCPFFSRDALRACLPTFDLNLSGWGLDCYLWPRKVAGQCYVVDCLPFGHYRAPVRRERVLRNGKTPQQECAEIAELCQTEYRI